MTPIGDHPDPDVLTAFAEGSLLERERRAVLGHLAGCSECRAVLSIAADAVPQVVAASKHVPIRPASHAAIRSWLPWGAAAAGIAIASIVGLRYEQSRTTHAPLTTQKQEAPAKAPAEVAQLQAPSAPREIVRKKSPAPTTPPRRLDTPRQNELAKNAKQAEQQSNEEGLRQIAGQVSDDQLRAQEMPATTTQSADIRTAVPNKPAPAVTNAAAAQAFGGAQAAPLARPQWRINGQGQPERSFGHGPWQPVFTGETSRMHVVSIIAGEVWVGGENSRIYRSSDQGATWQAVPLPTRDGGGHTIVDIRFKSAQTGTIKAADGTTWTTTDGGNTWK